MTQTDTRQRVTDMLLNFAPKKNEDALHVLGISIDDLTHDELRGAITFQNIEALRMADAMREQADILAKEMHALATTLDAQEQTTEDEDARLQLSCPQPDRGAVTRILARAYYRGLRVGSIVVAAICVLLVLATGCTSGKVNQDTIIGGGCDRVTTWGGEVCVMAICLNAKVHADCESGVESG